MSSESIRRQDASGGMPLCVWQRGELVAAVTDHADAEALIARLVAGGDDRKDFEILLPCHLHPLNSAVDCLDCEPI
jgi:hypothetical protein